MRDAVEDALSDNDRARKHAQGAFGGNIGNDVSDGSATGGRASRAGESVAQSAIDSGDPITRMHPEPTVNDRGTSGLAAEAGDDHPDMPGE